MRAEAPRSEDRRGAGYPPPYGAAPATPSDRLRDRCGLPLASAPLQEPLGVVGDTVAPHGVHNPQPESVAR